MVDILFAIAGLCFVIVTTIAPIIAILFRLFKKVPFKNTWILSSIILVGLCMLITIPALLANHFENKSYLKKTDQQFEEISDELSDGNSTDKIIMEIFKTGSYRKSGGRYGTGGNPNVSNVIKNYNDDNFKGTVIIYAIYNGEVIGEKEAKVELAGKEDSWGYLSPSDLNINRKIWSDVEFDYSIQGEFVQ